MLDMCDDHPARRENENYKAFNKIIYKLRADELVKTYLASIRRGRVRRLDTFASERNTPVPTEGQKVTTLKSGLPTSRIAARCAWNSYVFVSWGVEPETKSKLK